MPEHSRDEEQLISRRRFLHQAGTVTLAAGAAASTVESALAATFPTASSIKHYPAAKKLRIGVVGGNWGTYFPWHLHTDCEVTAVADLRADRRNLLMEKFHCSNAYAEFHPMLKDPKVDAVAIFTGAPDHVPHCVDVLSAGKHVICAVPAAITLEQCQKLVDAVKRSGQIYMMAETSCFDAATITARQWRKDGKFGRIYYTEGDYLHDHGSILLSGHVPPKLMSMFIYDEKPTWRYGNAQGLYLTHASGPIIYVTGEKLTEVVAIGTPIDHPFYKKNQYNNPFINTTFFFKTSGGNSAHVRIHWWTAAPGREGADYYGTKACFFEAKFGRPVHVSYPGVEAKPYEVDDHTSVLPPMLLEYVRRGRAEGLHPETYLDPVFIVHEFVSACLEVRAPSVDVYQAVAYTAPGICGFESAMKNGAWIKVPDFGPIS